MNRTEILSVLIYQPSTGIFRWRTRTGGKAVKGSIAGGVNSRGYVSLRVKGKNYTAHRLAFFLVNGFLPPEVDHIDGNKTNNSATNLRASTKSENQHNSKIRKDNSTGVKGVHWDSRDRKWVSSIKKDKVRHDLGRYESIFDAACAVISMRNRLHGDFGNRGDKLSKSGIKVEAE